MPGLHRFLGLLLALPSPLLTAQQHPNISWHFATPIESAAIRSGYIALTGEGPAKSCVTWELDHRPSGEVCTTPDGRFETVVNVSAGPHELRLEGAARNFTSHPPASHPMTNVTWNLLRVGDILLSRSLGSEQAGLFDSTFTHAAVYLGSDSIGTALIAEAVTEADAQGLGEVRTVPVEQALSYRSGSRVGIFRPAVPLTAPEQRATLDFLRSVVNRGLRYWSTAEDFSQLYAAWTLWDPRTDRPIDAAKFQQVLHQLEKQKLSADRFNCASLLWLAFWTGSQGRLDIAEPHRLQIGGRLAGTMSETFLARVSSYFVSADSLYLSGKLREITQ